MSGAPSSNQSERSAGIGRHVILELVYMDGSERLEVDIVQDQYSDFRNGFLGAGTPLAKAIQEHTAGQVIPYTVGEAKEIRLLAVSMSTTPAPKEVAERRKETIQKAIDQSDRTNAMIFASSFTGKWGDYDPTGFTEETPKKDPDSSEEDEVKGEADK